MKHERSSYAFLMEMIWVCAFFLICASIFVTAFAKSEQMSRQAATLNQAVLAVSSVMEEVFAEGEETDTDPTAADSSIVTAYSTETYSIEMSSFIEDGLLSVTVTAIDPQTGDVLYSLSGTRAVLEGGKL